MSGGAPQLPRITADDVMANGADRYAESISTFGNTPYGRRRAEESIRRLYPDADERAVGAALDRMGAARDAANRINRRTAAGALDRNAYPVDPGINRYPVPVVDPANYPGGVVPPGVGTVNRQNNATAYVYRVRVRYWYQGEERSVVAHVASVANLDNRQIHQRAMLMVQPWLDAHYADYEHSPVLDNPDANDQSPLWRVEFAYRRTQ